MNHAPKRLIIAAAALAAAAVCLCVPRTAHAEQPAWSLLKAQTYVIRSHLSLEPAATDTSGLWTFDPLSGAYRRLRPFHYNAAIWGIVDLDGGDGRGGFLATSGDRLVFEGWPSIFDYDAASLRLIRRTVALDPSLNAPGWVVEGPMIDAGMAATTGLAQGTYGFVTCLYDEVSIGGGFGHKQCDPTTFPGYDSPIKTSKNEVFFARSPAQELTKLTALFEPPPFTDNPWVYRAYPAMTAFDPGRSGFWLGTQTNISFHAIVDGEVRPQTTVMNLADPPISDPDPLLMTVFHQPTSKLFLLSWDSLDGSPDTHLSVLNDSLDQVLAEYVDGVGSARLPLALAAFAGDPPSQQTETIPIVVHTAGKNGTFWTSDLYLYNPSSEAMTVSVRRVTKPAETRTVNLPAYGSVTIPDALAWAGGGPAGDGTKHDALVLTSPYRWGENLVAAARVWTPDSDAELRARGGTMGQAVPAVPDVVGYSNHLPWPPTDDAIVEGGVYSHQFPQPAFAALLLDHRQPGRYRFNLGVVNDRDEPLTVRVLWRTAWHYLQDQGAQSLRTFDVPAHGVKIVDVESLFPAEIRDDYVPYLAVSADRAAALWFTMVDNVTGDATFVPYTLLDQLGDDFTRAAVPAVAHLPGHNGTVWRTDMYTSFLNPIFNDPEKWDRPPAWFHPSDPVKGCAGAGSDIAETLTGVLGMDHATWKATLDSLHYPLYVVDQELWGWRLIFPDLVHLFSACASDEDVRGGFEMKEGSWMGAFTRTYTTRADGGTYGGMLPLYPPHGWPVQHFAGLVVSPAFRINVGLYNGDADHAIVHRLTLYSADGTKVAEKEITLAPWANLVEPLESLLGLANGSLADGTYGLTVLPLDDPGNGVEGRSWAFVSLVDNVTGDSTNWW